MASELSPSQWQVLRRLKLLAHIDKTPGTEAREYVEAAKQLHREFGTFENAIAKAREFAREGPEYFVDHLRWIIAVSLITEGDHLPVFIRSLAEGGRTGSVWNLNSLISIITFAIPSAEVSIHYCLQEQWNARQGSFYEPCYPRLEDDNGVMRFDPADYVLVYEQSIMEHMWYCIADPLDFKDYFRLFDLFVSQAPHKKAQVVKEHQAVIAQCQMAAESPIRKMHLPGDTTSAELIGRVHGLIHHLMAMDCTPIHTRNLGSSLDERMGAIDNLVDVLAKASPKVCQEVEAWLLTLFSNTIVGTRGAGANWLPDDFAELEDPFVPMIRLMRVLCEHGVRMGDCILAAARTPEWYLDVKLADGLMTTSERVEVIGTFHAHVDYEPNPIRSFLLEACARMIDPESVRWDEISEDAVIGFYKIFPHRQIVRSTKSGRVKDHVFSQDLGL